MEYSEIKVPGHIENPNAYRRAVMAKIQARQFKARQKKARQKFNDWIKEDETRFQLSVDLAKAVIDKPHNDFFRSLNQSLKDWGSLTEKQEAAVRKSLVADKEFAAKRVEENAAAAAVSKYVGTKGHRCEFELTLIKSIFIERYDFWINILDDPDGNRFCYVGQQLDMEIGDQKTIRATIKCHEERDGVKQTKINRPVIQPKGLSEADFLESRHGGSDQGAIKL